jgi:hypothetical protein
LLPRRKVQASQSNEVDTGRRARDAIGAAVARRFAIGGYEVRIARRDAEEAVAWMPIVTLKGWTASNFFWK